MDIFNPTHSPIILPMVYEDLDSVDRINQESFPVPWTRDAIRDELKRKWAVIRVLRSASGERVCGFINFWVVGGEIHLHNIAVSHSMRGLGYGHALMQDLFLIAESKSIPTIILEVRRSNHIAIQLYRRFGFQKIGVRPLYYSDNQEDAVVMRCDRNVSSLYDSRKSRKG